MLVILMVIFALKYIIKIYDVKEPEPITDQSAKRCIFHIPMYIEQNGKSGSNVRPIKMLQAFKNIGYKVDVVMGYGKDRKQQINMIRR